MNRRGKTHNKNFGRGWGGSHQQGRGDSKEEDSTTKAEALTAVEEDSKEEVSNNKAVDMEEAEATSIQMTSTSNSQ